MIKKRRRPRRYTGVMQLFHNYSHDPKGRTHCKSSGNFPYTIEHVNGKHKISGEVAIGHGIGNKSQKFLFTKKLGDGWDMSSGVRIN